MFVENDIKLNFIDLFAGAGGLAEGFYQAGFNPIAQVEMNESAARTLETRAAFRYCSKQGRSMLNKYYEYINGDISRDELFQHVPKEVLKSVINMEMSSSSLKSIFSIIDGIMEEDGISHVNVIIGGPPCQSYSLVGRAQSSHMSHPMSEDPRNELYKMYTRFLSKYKPDMFVFENVVGIKSARGGEAYKNLRAQLKRVGYEIDCQVKNARNFGVLQNRERLIIIGWKKDTPYTYPEFEKVISSAYVNDLLDDLPTLKQGESSNCYKIQFEEISAYLNENGIRTKDDVLSLHCARVHNQRDTEIYKQTIRLWNAGHKRLLYDNLPEELKTHKNRSSFLDRFKVVEGDMNYCHTVLAHLSKDGHYFIHPDINQCRSITVREAARLQTFPDSYYFEGSRGAKYVQIGNAVPPLMAKGIAEEIKKELLKVEV